MRLNTFWGYSAIYVRCIVHNRCESSLRLSPHIMALLSLTAIFLNCIKSVTILQFSAIKPWCVKTSENSIHLFLPPGFAVVWEESLVKKMAPCSKILTGRTRMYSCVSLYTCIIDLYVVHVYTIQHKWRYTFTHCDFAFFVNTAVNRVYVAYILLHPSDCIRGYV